MEARQDLLLHEVLGRVTHIFGPTICRCLVVAPLRKGLERPMAANVVGREPGCSLRQLQSHCRLCGQCKLARE